MRGETPPRVVIATDKFKGSMSAAGAAAAIADGIRTERPDAWITEVPVADGGEGTLEAAVAAGYVLRHCATSCCGGRAVPFAMRGATAIVELAAVCGLASVPSDALAPLTASTYEVGEVVTAAIDAGAHRIVIGLGGSASTDGGAGMMQALGLSLTGPTGAALPAGGAALERLRRVELSRLDRRIPAVQFVVACDVDNPLLGRQGAAFTYGPQKGASGDDIARLERGLQRWANVTRAATGNDMAAVPGAGAAGGTAFAALAYLGAELRAGAELVLGLVGFDRLLSGAALVVTGEGSIDAQTLHGKAPAAVQRAAAGYGVPVVAIAGRAELSESEERDLGFTQVFELRTLEPDEGRSMSDAAALLRRTGAAVARAMLSAAEPTPSDT